MWRQIGQQMRADPLRARDIERAADGVGMSEDQLSAAKTLLEGYEQQIKAMREEQQAGGEEELNIFGGGGGGGGGDTSGFQAMRDAAVKQREKQAGLETQLLSDIKAVLKPEQQEKWVVVEQSMRRDQRLRRGIMSGERLNVREVVHDLQLEGETAGSVEGVLQQYDIEVDRQLVTRDQLMEQPMPDFRGFGDPDAMDAMRKRMGERREASVRVREVNKRFATQVEGLLPEGQRGVFTDRVKEGTYPEIFRKTSGAEALAKAMAMPDLVPDQLQEVARLEDEYKAKITTWKPKAVKAWDEFETQMTPDRIGNGGMQDIGRGLSEARRERRELDKATIEGLKKVLTADQAKELPDLERDEEGGRGGRGGNRRMPRVL